MAWSMGKRPMAHPITRPSPLRAGISHCCFAQAKGKLSSVLRQELLKEHSVSTPPSISLIKCAPPSSFSPPTFHSPPQPPPPLLLKHKSPHPSKCPTPVSSSTSPLAVRPLAGLSWSSSPTRSPRLPRISVRSALVRREPAALASPFTTRAPTSTASSPSSCFRVVTSPVAMAPVVRASTARSSRMRTST
ncbi:hypothetical protein IAQ61_002388 [Plenodomus lingam]|uniref:uncharacterized protein n=1 Tax=Leptosphaeria maculans TaxID=5022 RepID=UPI0033170FB9|nr:hypothetical protein IAQ61_002388 [Plenodomus lingam]